LVPEAAKYQLGKNQVVLDTAKDFATKAVTIVASGSLVPEALKAADMLREKNVGAVVIHASSVNHADVETVAVALKKTGGRLVTVEEHRLVGGMGSMLVHALALKGEALKVKSLGVGDHFGQSAYNAIDLYRKHGLDSVAIVKAATEL
jgi:transketolase